MEKRRATVFESKVERKRRRGWEVARDSSYEEETATVDYRRFENLWTRPSLFPSLPHWVRRIRPNARKKRNLHERTWALHCIAVVTDASKEISFFSLSLSAWKRAGISFITVLFNVCLRVHRIFPLYADISRVLQRIIFLRISLSFL